jgi:hypothetical protein
LPVLLPLSLCLSLSLALFTDRGRYGRQRD